MLIAIINIVARTLIYASLIFFVLAAVALTFDGEYGRAAASAIAAAAIFVTDLSSRR